MYTLVCSNTQKGRHSSKLNTVSRTYIIYTTEMERAQIFIYSISSQYYIRDFPSPLEHLHLHFIANKTDKTKHVLMHRSAL